MRKVEQHTVIDRRRLAALLDRERQSYLERNPKSHAAYKAATNLFGHVPMTWMNKCPGGFPRYVAKAKGSHVEDIDGHDIVDFSLGDTGAMGGHSPQAVVVAVQRRYAQLGGATAMMPSEAAAWVGADLTRRFGLPYWSFSLSATDANRWALRLARAITKRHKVLVMNYCYHGTVDESFVVLGPGNVPIPRPGNVGPPCDVAMTSRVVEFNDLSALERELSYRDVAAVLMEPALTNIGIVLPQEGYLQGVQALTRQFGSLLIFDETHTFSAGPGGCTKAWRLAPDMLTIGKAIAGGLPAGAYGMSAELAEKLSAQLDLDLVDVGGIGGTLAGNALSIEAIKATLESVLDDDAFDHMIRIANRYTAAVQQIIGQHDLPWSVSQLGARSEYRFCRPAPTNGQESQAATDGELEDFLHVYLANRDVQVTPFHNMALMSPATTTSDVDRHTNALDGAIRELLGS